MPSEFDNSGDELLISFHKQFAENQNHHQQLLITMVSAVAIALVGYSTVYVNTTTQANLWDITRDKDAHIISYSLVTLGVAYLFAQIIFWLLGLVNLNIGYGFRRDQIVNKEIRLKYLGTEYSSIFGNKPHYNPEGKSITEFLPDFNTNFQVFLVLLQLLLMLTIDLSIFHTKSIEVDFASMSHVCLKYLAYFLICATSALPIIGSFAFIKLYHNKYKKLFDKSES